MPAIKLTPVPSEKPDLRWLQLLQQVVNDALGSTTTTAKRPLAPFVGYSIFDVTLNKPIWCKSLNPVVWVDASGTAV